MYQIISWGPYDHYQIIALVKTDKDLIELNKKFHDKYNIPWDDCYFYEDKRKLIEDNLVNNGFKIDINGYRDELGFVKAFIKWLSDEYQIEVLDYKETRFDDDPDYEYC